MAVEHLSYVNMNFTPIQGGANDFPGVEEITQADVEKLLKKRDQVEQFQILMMKYDCALSEVRTKLDVLNKELSLSDMIPPK